MFSKILEGKALEQYVEEDFKLEIYKSKGMTNPGLKFKGSQHGLLTAYAKLVEQALTDDVIPAGVLHNVLIFIAEDLGKLPHDEEKNDENRD